MTPVRLEPAALRSRVKHSTTEPLRSLVHYENRDILFRAEKKHHKSKALVRKLILTFIAILRSYVQVYSLKRVLILATFFKKENGTAILFNCKTVGQVSDSMAALTFSFKPLVGTLCLSLAGPTVAQREVFFRYDYLLVMSHFRQSVLKLNRWYIAFVRKITCELNFTNNRIQGEN